MPRPEAVQEARVAIAAAAAAGANELQAITELAASEGLEDAVGALAEGGADLDKAGSWGATPLMEAARMGHGGVVRRLLELGADHAAVGTGRRCEGMTALELAEERGEEEAAAALREWAASHPS
eukprot:COSAG04_NODE_4901_length_1833_cov_1.688581_2_plen_124_part_00